MRDLCDANTDHRVPRIGLSAPAGILEIFHRANFADKCLARSEVNDLCYLNMIANPKRRTSNVAAKRSCTTNCLLFCLARDAIFHEFERSGKQILLYDR